MNTKQHNQKMSYCFLFFLLLSINLSGQNSTITFGIINIDSIVSNINKTELNTFFIKKNTHSPLNRKFRLHKSKEFAVIALFDTTCLYHFDNIASQSAINKVFGYSFGGDHHKNSFRIGWRCKDSLIEVLAYWYINKKRCSELLFEIPPNKRFFAYAKIHKKEVELKYCIDNQQIMIAKITYNPNNYKLKQRGYINYPFFGGKRKAPHSMKIYLKAWVK